jgi:cell division protein FtsB
MPILSKQNLTSKLAIFLLFILLAFLGNLKYQQWKNQKKIEAEKQSLQKQADSLMKKNNELSESLEYINSPNFKERVARQQLNLKKEGETVYSFIELKNTNENTEQQNKGESNASKWWNYFFVN